MENYNKSSMVSKLSLRKALTTAILKNIPKNDIYIGKDGYRRVNIYNIPKSLSGNKYQRIRFNAKCDSINPEQGITNELLSYLLEIFNTKNNGYSYNKSKKMWFKDDKSLYVVASGFVKYN